MADSAIGTARDDVVELLNAAVAADQMPMPFVAERRIVPPLKREEIEGEGVFVLVLPSTATVKRANRGKMQQTSTITVGICEAVTLADGAPDQVRCDQLMQLAEAVADEMSKTSIGEAADLSPYDPERMKEGIFLAVVTADYVGFRDVRGLE